MQTALQRNPHGSSLTDSRLRGICKEQIEDGFGEALLRVTFGEYRYSIHN